RPPVDGGAPLWPEFNQMIGGYFKFHWLYPTQVAVQIEDFEKPVNAPFTSLNATTGVRLPRPFSVVDEVYTFNDASFSRHRAHVLTSIDTRRCRRRGRPSSRAPSAPITTTSSVLAHILTGMQYVLGDLQGRRQPVE